MQDDTIRAAAGTADATSAARLLAPLRHACTDGASASALATLLARHVTVLRQLAAEYARRGDHASAAANLREVLELAPQEPAAWIELGNAQRGMGDMDGAIASMRQAVAVAPGSAACWYHLGRMLGAHALTGQARQALERALSIDPGLLQARGALGDMLNSLGDIEGAAACFRACTGVRAHAPRAWSRIANLKTLRMTAADVVELRELLAQPSLREDERVFLGYALSKALEDQDDYAGAFAVLQVASAIKRRQVSWDAARFTRWIDGIDAAFMRAPAGVTDRTFGQEVIFLVGLPRSGSTLTEQILASHPQVEGTSELSDLHAVLNEESLRRDREFPEWVAQASEADWRRLGEAYLQRTARWRQKRPRFTDKGLDNWPLVGAALAMLPGARVVNCRRDALETCLSCYRQLFLHGNFASYDLREMAACWHDYDRLSRAWRQRYPGQVFDAVYEDLLADPQAQIRRLLDFLGLAFDPACLAFHRSQRAVHTFSAGQVREPLRADTARAHRYGSALDPLREALAQPRRG